jgi:hypothetical protein
VAGALGLDIRPEQFDQQIPGHPAFPRLERQVDEEGELFSGAKPQDTTGGVPQLGVAEELKMYVRCHRGSLPATR